MVPPKTRRTIGDLLPAGDFTNYRRGNAGRGGNHGDSAPSSDSGHSDGPRASGLVPVSPVSSTFNPADLIPSVHSGRSIGSRVTSPLDHPPEQHLTLEEGQEGGRPRDGGNVPPNLPQESTMSFQEIRKAQGIGSSGQMGRMEGVEKPPIPQKGESYISSLADVSILTVTPWSTDQVRRKARHSNGQSAQGLASNPAYSTPGGWPTTSSSTSPGNQGSITKVQEAPSQAFSGYHVPSQGSSQKGEEIKGATEAGGKYGRGLESSKVPGSSFKLSSQGKSRQNEGGQEKLAAPSTSSSLVNSDYIVKCLEETFASQLSLIVKLKIRLKSK